LGERSGAREAGVGRVRGAVLCTFAALALTSPARSQTVGTQFWPEVDTYFKFNDDLRLFVPVSQTRSGESNSYENGTIGVYLDYFTQPLTKLDLYGPANAARRRQLQFRAGYAYTASRGQSPATSTIDAEGTFRLLLPAKILVSERNRFDLNFTSGKFDPRYRNRIRLERSFGFGQTKLIPYANGEFFYGFNAGRWIKTRAAAGVDVQAWERFVPEVYVQRDYNHGSGPDITGFGLLLSIYLR